MEAQVLACLSFVTAFCAAGILVPRLIAIVRRHIAGAKVQRRAVRAGGALQGILRNGVAVFFPLARLVLRNGRASCKLESACAMCAGKALPSTPQNVCSVLCACTLGVAFVAGLLSASLVCGVTLGFCLVAAFFWVVNREQEKQIDALREAIPDALRSMSVCFHAGLSLLQTFQQVAEEVDEPLKKLFMRAAHDLETGHTATEALQAFRENSATNELAFVAVALDIQHKTGGSLQQVLDAASDSIRSELELRRSLRVQTAQAKLSARVVSVMPFVLVALFSLLSQDFLAPFFQSFAGLALLGLAIAMEAAGILAVRRLLNGGWNA
ncbi:MAG: type II secretion system F family protein [Raoultibacter sp.]